MQGTPWHYEYLSDSNGKKSSGFLFLLTAFLIVASLVGLVSWLLAPSLNISFLSFFLYELIT